MSLKDDELSAAGTNCPITSLRAETPLIAPTQSYPKNKTEGPQEPSSCWIWVGSPVSVATWVAGSARRLDKETKVRHSAYGQGKLNLLIPRFLIDLASRVPAPHNRSAETAVGVKTRFPI